MLEALKEAWEIYPDMRLGQLLCVCAGAAAISGVEDDVMLAGIKQYRDSMKASLGKGLEYHNFKQG